MTDPVSIIMLCSCGIYYIGHCICFSCTFLKELIERRRLEPVLIKSHFQSSGNFVAVQDISDDFTLT